MNNLLLSEKNKHILDSRIFYIKKGHKYFIDNDNTDIISITTYIHTFFNDFDIDFNIKKILNSDDYKNPDYKYFNMTYEQIKNLWEKNGLDARLEGTKLHEDIEKYYNNITVENDTQEFKYFLNFFNDFKNQLEPYRTEWYIFYDILKLSGSIDIVFKNNDGTLSIGDWKRSKNIYYNSFSNEKGKFPINHLDDCNYNHYSLQLNMYKIILEKVYNQKVKELFLIILYPDNDNYIKINIEIMDKEINYLLDFRKKQLIELGYHKDLFMDLKLDYIINFDNKNLADDSYNYEEKDTKIIPLLKKTKIDRDKEFNKKSLSENQKIAYDLMVKGHNIFLTGPGGTGKTAVIKLFCKNYSNIKKIAITSTTGISAILINGVTLHSYLGIGLGNQSVENLYLKILNTSYILKKWIEINTLIIDEISMLDPILFDKLEILARKIRKIEKPFGGIQLILTGDFLQLPVINSKNFCFEAKSWSNCIQNIIYLKDIFRQSDLVFQNCLNELRVGIISESTKKILKSRLNITLKNEYGIIPTKLHSLNKDVDYENQKELDKLLLKNENLDFYQYELQYEILKKGLKFVEEKIKKLCMVKQTLELCIGAQVMLLCNLDLDNGLANGSRGVIIGFDIETNLPIVKFLSGIERIINLHTWTIEENNEKILNVMQIPLKVSFAISIHKCQGLTIDFAEIDLSGVFEYGQAYVALSRVKNLQGLSIKNLDFDRIIADPKAVSFYENL